MSSKAIILSLATAVSLFASAAGASSSSFAGYCFIEDGRAIVINHTQNRSMHGTHYAVVCLNAVNGASIDDVTPRYRKAAGKLVRREVIDEGTWGFVFELSGGPVPFAVWSSPAKFREQGTAFWMAKR